MCDSESEKFATLWKVLSVLRIEEGDACAALMGNYPSPTTARNCLMKIDWILLLHRGEYLCNFNIWMSF